MRRYIIIFFVALLPFQFVWGVAASYCAHEKGELVSHFGHHAHVHKVTTQSDEAAKSLAGNSDVDCVYCHIGCVQPPPSIAENLPVASLSIYVSHKGLAIRLGIPDFIERPNWSLAV